MRTRPRASSNPTTRPRARSNPTTRPQARSNRTTKPPTKTNPRSNKKKEDCSVLRPPVDTSIQSFSELMEIFEKGTPELKELLDYECKIIYECQICRSLFRGLPNFITHKRSYCFPRFKDMNDNEERIEQTLVLGNRRNTLTRRTTTRKDILELLDNLKTNYNINGPFVMRDMEQTSQGLLNVFNNEEPQPTLERSATLGPDGRIIGSEPLEESDNCTLYNSRDETQTHSSEEHPELKQYFTCPLCTQYFAQSSSVYRHMCTVHRKTCKEAQKLKSRIETKFLNKHDVNRQRKKANEDEISNMDENRLKEVTNQESLMVCQTCGKKFDSKDTIVAHATTCAQQPLKIKLKRSIESDVTTPPLKRLKEVANQENLIICPTSRKKFDSKVNIGAHATTCAQQPLKIEPKRSIQSDVTPPPLKRLSEVANQKNLMICPTSEKKLDSKVDIVAHATTSAQQPQKIELKRSIQSDVTPPHLKRLNEVANQENLMICPTSEKKFDSKVDIVAHATASAQQRLKIELKRTIQSDVTPPSLKRLSEVANQENLIISPTRGKKFDSKVDIEAHATTCAQQSQKIEPKRSIQRDVTPPPLKRLSEVANRKNLMISPSSGKKFDSKDDIVAHATASAQQRLKIILKRPIQSDVTPPPLKRLSEVANRENLMISPTSGKKFDSKVDIVAHATASAQQRLKIILKRSIQSDVTPPPLKRLSEVANQENLMICPTSGKKFDSIFDIVAHATTSAQQPLKIEPKRSIQSDVTPPPLKRLNEVANQENLNISPTSGKKFDSKVDIVAHATASAQQRLKIELKRSIQSDVTPPPLKVRRLEWKKFPIIHPVIDLISNDDKGKSEITNDENTSDVWVANKIDSYLDRNNKKCLLCHKIFLKLVYAKHHIAMHLNLYKFECTICNIKYYFRSDLYKHQIEAHQVKHPYKMENSKRLYPKMSDFNDLKLILDVPVNDDELSIGCLTNGQNENISNSSLDIAQNEDNDIDYYEPLTF